MKTIPSPEQLARAFSLELRAHLGTKDLKAAIELNRTEDHPNVCHTHDYCDANCVMGAALEQFGISDRELFGDDGLSPEIAAVWNDAWELAKQNEFWIGSPVSQDEFFRLEAVREAQAVQKANPYGSVEHRNAWRDMCNVAASMGLGDKFKPTDY